MMPKAEAAVRSAPDAALPSGLRHPDGWFATLPVPGLAASRPACGSPKSPAAILSRLIRAARRKREADHMAGVVPIC
jgi:hypothetical protein